jgi:hypothetical protein
MNDYLNPIPFPSVAAGHVVSAAESASRPGSKMRSRSDRLSDSASFNLWW